MNKSKVIQKFDQEGRLHCEDSPALILPNGSNKWYVHGTLHREGGPAVRWVVMEGWYRNGVPHREDGPAIIWTDYREEYWIDGIQYTKEEFYNRG